MTASRVEPACMSPRLPISSFLVVRTTRAPVAQLDRALPSEGRGREFESRRVRQVFNYLGYAVGGDVAQWQAYGRHEPRGRMVRPRPLPESGALPMNTYIRKQLRGMRAIWCPGRRAEEFTIHKGLRGRFRELLVDAILPLERKGQPSGRPCRARS